MTSDAKPQNQLMFQFDHDDRARAGFVVALKQRVKLGLESRLERHFDAAIAPALEAERGARLNPLDKTDRKAAKRALAKDHTFKSWALLSHRAQRMKWDCALGVLDHELPRLQNAADALTTQTGKRGSLSLDPQLPLPKNIAETEIHLQPGGFCFEEGPSDISAGALYNIGATMGPLSARGVRNFSAGRSAGDFVCETLKARFPEFRPVRILELGCGTGRNTPAYARQFPSATVTAIDCAPGLLRWAHAFAEAQGVTVDFKQMDVTNLEFAENTFDLVVSHIVGHETTHQGLPRMIAEAWRVLKPGGVMFHLDVATQPSRLSVFEQVINDWQVRFNGEPFWMGWADADIPGLLAATGVPADMAISEYLTPAERGASFYCYGGRKPADKIATAS